MKRLLPALFLCLGAALFAQTPYYTDGFSSIDPTKWQQNGTLEIYVRGLISWDANGGSLISLVPPPDGSGQYEVRTVMDVLDASWPNHAATFVTYLGPASMHYRDRWPQGSTMPSSFRTCSSTRRTGAAKGRWRCISVFSAS